MRFCLFAAALEIHGKETAVPIKHVINETECRTRKVFRGHIQKKNMSISRVPALCLSPTEERQKILLYALGPSLWLHGGSEVKLSPW